jgi:hypothetical protein
MKNKKAEKEIRGKITFPIASKYWIPKNKPNKRRWNTSTMKTTKPWREKFNKTLQDGKTTNVHQLAELNWGNGYNTESNLQNQCNLQQHSNVIFHKNRKINPKIHMKTQHRRLQMPKPSW